MVFIPGHYRSSPSFQHYPQRPWLLPINDGENLLTWSFPKQMEDKETNLQYDEPCLVPPF
jgi:hypothetical protein